MPECTQASASLHNNTLVLLCYPILAHTIL